MGVRGLFIGVVLVCMSAASAGSAQPLVVWEVADGCPDASENDAEITRLLARTVHADEVALRATVKLLRVADGSFEARISLGDRAQMERVLRDNHCQVLARASAVVIALAIREALRARRRSEEAVSKLSRSLKSSKSSGRIIPDEDPAVPASPPETPAPISALDATPVATAQPSIAASGIAKESSAAESTAVPPSAAPRLDSPVLESQEVPVIRHGPSSTAFFCALGASLGLGILPRLAPGLAGSIGLHGQIWHVALRVSRGFAQSARLSEQATAGGAVAMTAASIEGGLRARLLFPELRGIL